MAFSIYSLTDENNQTAYYAVVKIQINRKKLISSRYFESDKATARQWAKSEETRLKLENGGKVSNIEKVTYVRHTALQQNSSAKAFNDLFKIMGGRKQQPQGATA
ncbi:hypothetical protein [Rodentibacter heidelbergensis]|uniref:Uncharacterized protein n=1 Tax=Rodentibacter heidelbergensis TaxID=1908258 RepID=A0A1V3IBH6_9PAST|nr:hypothetical protein [Rodentibacter heidelbergensis]OOF37384.1 hypothetical protein BKK48_02125 [Rodentibacter heidelbergensis]